MRLSFVAQLGEHFQHLAFEGMVWAGHANMSREVVEGGSVS